MDDAVDAVFFNDRWQGGGIGNVASDKCRLLQLLAIHDEVETARLRILIHKHRLVAALDQALHHPGADETVGAGH